MKTRSMLPPQPATTDGWPGFFDELAPRYDAAAFGGCGLAAVGDQELSVVLTTLAARTPGSVLDAGAGTGRFTRALTERGWSVTALDASPVMVERLRASLPGLPVLHAALGHARLPLDDASFDAVVSLRVLKYVADIDGAMRELARVLRPGGIAVLEFPNRWSVARFGYRGAAVHLVSLRRIDRALVRGGLTRIARTAGPRLPQPVWARARTPRAARVAGACDRVLGAILGGNRTATGARSVIVVGRRV